MPSNTPSPISKAEVVVMKVIWEHEPISVRSVYDTINLERKEPLSRTTILKHIQRLETKDWIVRDDSRPALYTSLVSSQVATRNLIRGFKEMLFDGSTMSMVRCLVNEGELSKDELSELQKLIDSSESTDGKNNQ